LHACILVFSKGGWLACWCVCVCERERERALLANARDARTNAAFSEWQTSIVSEDRRLLVVAGAVAVAAVCSSCCSKTLTTDGFEWTALCSNVSDSYPRTLLQEEGACVCANLLANPIFGSATSYATHATSYATHATSSLIRTSSGPSPCRSMRACASVCACVTLPLYASSPSPPPGLRIFAHSLSRSRARALSVCLSLSFSCSVSLSTPHGSFW
jgi:hypothetical protein